MQGFFQVPNVLSAALVDISIKLTVFVALVLFVRRLRSIHSAARQLIFTSAFGGALLLPLFTWLTPPLPLALAPAVAVHKVKDMVQLVTPAQVPPRRSEEAAGITKTASTISPRNIPWPWIVFCIYVFGLAVMLVRLAIGLYCNRRVLSRSTAVNDSEARNLLREFMPQGQTVHLLLCPAVVVPSAVGWLKARVLLPSSWNTWDLSKKRAVLAHELCHVRRRDNLLRSLALLNQCIYWFHPLSWLLASELSHAAEEASDHAGVLAVGSRKQYAKYLLEIASLLEGRRSGLLFAAVTMGSSKELDRRIDQILSGRPILDRLVSFPVRVAVISGCVLLTAALAAPRFAYGVFEPVSPQAKPARPASLRLDQTVQDEASTAAPVLTLTATIVHDAPVGKLKRIAPSSAQESDGNGIDLDYSFAEKTETRTYRMVLTSSTEPVRLKFGAHITEGRIVWQVTDPIGERRMGVQTTANAAGWTDGIRSIPGEWELTMRIENATGNSWIRWSR